MTSHKHSKI